MKNTNYSLDRDNDILSSYLAQIDRFPLLTPEEELEVANRAKRGDRKAREQLVNCNLRFVVSVAKKFRGQGMSLEDLIEEGNYGLMTAVDKFDPDKGYRFISYAVWWIRQSIMKALSEQGRAIRLPLNRSNDLVTILRAKEELVHKTGKSNPSNREIAEATGLDEKVVRDLLDITREMISFDAPVKSSDDESRSFGDFVEAETESPEEKMVSSRMSEDVSSLLRVLTEKERDIIEKRYGFNDTEPMSLKAIGDQYNLTKERIRQIEKGALEKLRASGESLDLASYCNVG